MCTAFIVYDKNILFGRNMDLDYSFNESVLVIPKNYNFKFKKEESLYSKYSILGIGTLIDGYPMFADAMNSEGLAFAGLAFEGNCKYYEYQKGKINLTPYELPLYLLSICSSIEQVRIKLKDINLLNEKINEQVDLANLHFIFADKKESIVIEPLKEGVKIYDNPYNLLTNNPPFDYHVYNLSNYLQLHNDKPINKIDNKVNINICSYNQGAIGLPGDFSSSSRFVKCFYIKSNLILDGSDNDYNEIFKCLDSVSMVKGAVKTKLGYEITRYSICYDLKKCCILYKTYEKPLPEMYFNDSENTSFICRKV